PWIILGDLNTVRYSNEKKGGRPILPSQVIDVNTFYDNASMLDLPHTAWNKQVRGTLLFQLCQKLKFVKTALRDWNKQVFGVVQSNTSTVRDELIHYQKLCADNPQNVTYQDQENQCRMAYIQALEREEMFAKQKSKQQWLSLGDSNTKFFYAAIKARKVDTRSKQVDTSPRFQKGRSTLDQSRSTLVPNSRRAGRH
ncbi:hypothetical protein Taro_056099, partial [Colocasia esculenta]|nr:hypothetical protein [Colocasia esculenta]